MSLESLKASYPWPSAKPMVPPNPHGWLVESTRKVLGEWVLSASSPVIVELGSWLGASARFLLDQNRGATVACVDTWLGSREHQHPNNDQHGWLPTLHETFLVNMWNYQDRCIPVRSDTLTGLGAVADHQVKPDLVYIDAGHDWWSVYADLCATLELFPTVHIIGDDWTHPRVQQGVKAALEHHERGRERSLDSEGNTWWLTRKQ